MKYTTKIFDNYKIHLIETNKFKKNTISFKFRMNTISFYNEILKDVLCIYLSLSTNKYPTKRLLEMKCEELFNCGFSLNNKNIGKQSIFTISASFLSNKYTLEKTDEEVIDFIKEIIFNPRIINNSFDEKLVNKAIKIYIEDIKSVKENPTQYSIIKMRNLIESDSLYSNHPLYFIDQIEKITCNELYNIYKEIISKSNLEIFLLGTYEKNIFDSLSDIKVNNNIIKNEIYDIVEYKLRDKEKIEEDNYSQSKLSISYSLNNLSDFEGRYVSKVFSYILGESSNSLLFNNLREKNSLCYYANSVYLPYYQILEIRVGLEGENYNIAIRLIDEILDNLKKGKFSDTSIDEAKMTYINAWNEITDNEYAIISLYSMDEFYKFGLINEKIEEIKKVTKEDVMCFANKLKLNLAYLLKGINENEQN